MNTVVLIGRLVRDPELKYTPSGAAVAEMRIAVDRAGDRQDDGSYGAGFFDVSVFGRAAENSAQYLFKGSQAGFSGALKFHEWEDQDGKKRSKIEITAFQVQFLGSKGDNERTPPAESGKDATAEDFDFATPGGPSDDDIPF